MLADLMSYAYRVAELVFGLGVLIGLAWLCSVDRRNVNWALVFKGILLQFAFAVLVLWTKPGRLLFLGAKKGFQALIDASVEGSEFVFGQLADIDRYGFLFFIHVSATIILVSALMSALYYLGIMQWVVWAMAKVMQVVLGTSGAESLAAAANIFAGQTEAPLVVKPYLKTMTPSEIMSLMTGGMSTIAGGVMAAYVGMLQDDFPDIAGHILSASVMSAPAALVVAKIMVPETGVPETLGEVRVVVPREGRNLLDAICKGASDGLYLALNVMAMLVAFISLIALTNTMLSWAGNAIADTLGLGPDWQFLRELSLEQILGWLCAPLALVMGVPPKEAVTVGMLLGERTIVNEFVAYEHLDRVLASQGLSMRTTVIATYALCGFANFTSVAIQIGGIGAIVPTKREDLARYGLRAMIAGTLACFMTATIAGALVPGGTLLTRP